MTDYTAAFQQDLELDGKKVGEQKISQAYLLERLKECPKDGVWIHEKTQRRYLVVGRTIIEKTLEPAVLYITFMQDSGSDHECKENVQIDDKYVVWCRPLSEWNEKFRKMGS